MNIEPLKLVMKRPSLCDILNESTVAIPDCVMVKLKKKFRFSFSASYFTVGDGESVWGRLHERQVFPDGSLSGGYTCRA